MPISRTVSSLLPAAAALILASCGGTDTDAKSGGGSAPVTTKAAYHSGAPKEVSMARAQTFASKCTEGGVAAKSGGMGGAGENLASEQSQRFDGTKKYGSLGTPTAVLASGDKKCFDGFTAAVQTRSLRFSGQEVPLALSANRMRENSALSAVLRGGPVVMEKFHAFQKKAYEKAYGVLDRVGWNARRRKGRDVPMMPVRMTVHHTEGHRPSGEKQTAQKVRDIQYYHMVGRALQGKEAFDDIGYHFLIAGDGRVVQGRKSNVLGAHAYRANRNNIGIALMGNFNKMQPNYDQIESLKRLVAYLAVKYDIDPAHSGTLEGHGHYTPTDCPGLHLRNRLADLRRAAHEEMIAMRGRNKLAAESFTVAGLFAIFSERA